MTQHCKVMPVSPTLQWLDGFSVERVHLSNEARANASALSDAILAKGFAGASLPPNKLAANLLIISEGEAYLQYHALAGRFLPPGGKVKPEDKEDLVLTALREGKEEVPAFARVINEAFLPSQPILDVEIKQSDIKDNEGTWWFLTVMLLLPPMVRHSLHTPDKGKWVPLTELLVSPDPALARPALVALDKIAQSNLV